MKLIKKKIQLDNNIIISYLDNEATGKEILVFVHGWGADKFNLQSIYYPLLNDYRIIAIDLPGFGDSSVPNNIIGSNEYAEYLFYFLKKIKITKINYIGHSFGGKIGIVLSCNFPQLIQRLVLIDSSGLRPRRYLDWYIKVGLFKTLRFFLTYIFKSKLLLEKLKNNFGSSDYKKAGRMRNILVKSVNEDYFSSLKNIKCPVFLYWGEKDKETPLWMAKKMKKEIEDSALYIVKNGSHFSFLEDQRIVAIIKAFVI